MPHGSSFTALAARDDWFPRLSLKAWWYILKKAWLCHQEVRAPTRGGYSKVPVSKTNGQEWIKNLFLHAEIHVRSYFHILQHMRKQYINTVADSPVLEGRGRKKWKGRQLWGTLWGTSAHLSTGRAPLRALYHVYDEPVVSSKEKHRTVLQSLHIVQKPLCRDFHIIIFCHVSL